MNDNDESLRPNEWLFDYIDENRRIDQQRYLWLRQLNPRQFAELHRRAIEENQSFDAMVDNHIATKTFPVGRP